MAAALAGTGGRDWTGSGGLAANDRGAVKGGRAGLPPLMLGGILGRGALPRTRPPADCKGNGVG